MGPPAMGPGDTKLVYKRMSVNLDTLAVNTLRCLSLDQVEAAKSGHPGLPLGAAAMAYTLFKRHLQFDPLRPDWFNRDRFILSAGHGSALNYALLHVFGYDLSVDDLKGFRQLHSRTPGHPEFRETPGIEATTGPLGQGAAMAAGLAVAEAHLRAVTKGLVDHFTYALVSDGDLMEGIGCEAASLAGHLKLGRLIYLYDANDISLDGPTSYSYTEDPAAKFTACGWHVQTVADGNDVEAIDQAITEAKKVEDKPSLIIVKTKIGFGSPSEGTSEAHGAPLGPDKTKATKDKLGWPSHEPFFVPSEIAEIQQEFRTKGTALSGAWEQKLGQVRSSDPAIGSMVDHMASGTLPEGWEKILESLVLPDSAQATRDSGKAALNAAASALPWVIGGAADLASSTKTAINGSPRFSLETPEGRNVFFGVREHAMGAMVNGMALHGFIPFGSTFLVFSDYMRGAIRLSSLMELPSLWIFTHDSVFVGEDGPTHQPIEHVAALRIIPGLDVYRPAGAAETAACMAAAINRQKPSALILTRQNLPVYREKQAEIWEGAQKGAYILEDTEGMPDVILAATGSEISLAFQVKEALKEHKVEARIVSVPCLEVFREQEVEYIVDVVPIDIPVVTMEAGVTFGWEDLAGDLGLTLGINRFGMSGPGQKVYEELGMTVESVVEDVLFVTGADLEDTDE